MFRLLSINSLVFRELDTNITLVKKYVDENIRNNFPASKHRKNVNKKRLETTNI